MFKNLMSRAGLNASEMGILGKLPDLFPGMMAYWDKDSRCVFANENYLEWFGLSADQMRGIKLSELLPRLVYEKDLPHIDGALKGDHQRFQRDLTKADQSHGQVLVQYIPYFSEGEVQGFFALETDVTKERDLAGKVALFETAFDSVRQGVAITDLDRRIVYCNSAYLDITGYALSDLLGRNPNVLEGEKTNERKARKLTQCMERNEAFEDVLLNYKKNKEPFFNALSISVARDEAGNPTHFIDVIHDVSDELEAKVNLECMNADLERRVELRTAELGAANAALRKSVDDLLANKSMLAAKERQAALGSMGAAIGHELATPLGNSRMAGDALASQLCVFRQQLERGVKRSEIERFMARCSQTADVLTVNLDRASEIVSVFKRVAVSDADPTKRLFTLGGVIENAALSMRPTLDKSSIVVDYSEVDEHLSSWGQPGPLTQVFVNLLQNSVIHGYPTKKPGRVRIEGKLISENLAQLVFEDDGVGIPDEAMAQIFDPFFTTKRGEGGSGIGMHLAKKNLEELYGASIEVGNAEGGGARFKIVFPLSMES